MLLRHHLVFTFLLALLLLASVSAAQTQGGGVAGGARPSGVAPPARNPSSSNTSHFPSGAPLSTADAQGKIAFRNETILVQVPVVITDKRGNHVHGLSKDEFHVLENGKEQKLSTFEEIVSVNTRFPMVAAAAGEFSNLSFSTAEHRTVTVIAIDTVNTPFLDQTYGRRELVKYLAGSLDSGQVLALMIISSHGLKIVQGITGDPAQLLQVLKKIGGEIPASQGDSPDAQADAAVGDIPSALGNFGPNSDPDVTMETWVEHGDAIDARFQQQNAIETTLNAFLGISWSLSGIPGRKSLIWATGGFPFTIGSPATLPGGYLSTVYERTMSALASAQISVYPVDVRGLTDTAAIGEGSRRRMPTARQINNRVWAQQATIDSLNEFAEMTGGKAFYDTNDLAFSFKRAADASSSYYLVGYYLDTKNKNAGWRQLKVKIDKKDTEVRARKGFFVTNATIHAELTRNSDLSYALTSPIDGTGVPVIMKWLGVSGAGDKKKASFTVRLPPNSVSIEAAAGENYLNLDFAVAAFADKSNGQPSATTGKTFKTSVAEAQMALLRNKGLGFTDALELGPGQYTVRFVVRDNLTGKLGSVTAPLTVN